MTAVMEVTGTALVAEMEHAAPVGNMVDAVEAWILQYPQLDIPPVHRFADGLYAREITIPAGSIVTGKIHKTRHLNIVSAGKISVYCEGEPVRHITAPFTFIAEPGARRVGVAHEDTVWTTIHGTHETDVEQLEALLIEPHDNPLLMEPHMTFLPERV